MSAIYIYLHNHIRDGYFTNDPLDGDNKYAPNDICKITEFLVDNIYM